MSQAPIDPPEVAAILKKLRGLSPAILGGSGAPEVPPELLAVLVPASEPGEIGRLGPYRIRRLLGQGGMGAVFEAVDPALGRPAAVKIMLPSLATDPTARTRFLREARAAAAVEHENIVPIYHVGEDGGVPFLAMPLLPGRSLETRLAAEPTLPAAEVAEIGRQIARGLAAAHSKELVHRDIKPSNVWLEEDSNGSFLRVRLLDFGLARAADQDDRITISGHLVGTPAYMAPEQARGCDPDPRADLFSLGVILYEAATGRRPFVGPTAIAVLSAVAVDTPPSPSAVNRQLPARLSALIERLLAKDPSSRPGSALEVATALEAILSAQSGEIPTPRHRRASLVVVLLCVVAVMASLFGWPHDSGIPSAPSARVEAASGQSPTTSREPLPQPSALRDSSAERKLYARTISLAQALIRNDRAARAHSLLEECPAHLRGWEWAYLDRNSSNSRLTLPKLESARFVQYMPDGQIIVSLDTKHVRTWDVQTGKELVRRPVSENITAAIALSLNRVAVTGDGGSVSVFDPRTGDVATQLRGLSPSVIHLDISRDGNCLVTSHTDGTTRAWNLAVNRETARVTPARPSGAGVASFSPDGKLVASFDGDRTVRVWNPANGEEQTTYTNALRDSPLLWVGPDDRALVTITSSGVVVKDLGTTDSPRMLEIAGNCAAADYDGRLMATGHRSGKIVVWNTETWKPIWSSTTTSMPVECVSLSANGRYVAAGGKDGTIRVWEVVDGSEPAVWSEHTSSIITLEFHPKELELMSLSQDGTIKFWPLVPRIASIFIDGETPVAVSSDGRRVATASGDKLTIRNLDSQPICSIRSPRRGTIDSTFRTDGRRVAIRPGDGSIQIWDADTGKVLSRLTSDPPGDGVVFAPCFDPTSRRVAAAFRRIDSWGLLVWDSDTGERLVRWDADRLPPVIAPMLAFSPDGSRLVVTNADPEDRKSITVFDSMTARPVREFDGVQQLTGIARYMYDAAFSPDGARLAVAYHNGIVKVWDLATRTTIVTLTGHAAAVRRVIFMPDGGRLVTMSDDQSVRVWDAATGDQLLELPALGRPRGLAFNTDGQLLAAADVLSLFDAGPPPYR